MKLPDLIARLQQQLDAMPPNDKDCKSENERDRYRHDYDRLQSAISKLKNLPDDLAQEQRLIDDWTPHRTEWLAKEKALEAALAAGPSDFEGKTLAYQLRLLRKGLLMRGLDQTFGSLEYFDQVIGDATRRRDVAKSSLAGTIAQAEALLGATVG